MKIQFLVTIEAGRRDAQPLKEFEKADCKAFVPYLKEKLSEAIKDSWQYNAIVDNYSIKVQK